MEPSGTPTDPPLALSDLKKQPALATGHANDQMHQNLPKTIKNEFLSNKCNHSSPKERKTQFQTNNHNRDKQTT